MYIFNSILMKIGEQFFENNENFFGIQCVNIIKLILQNMSC